MTRPDFELVPHNEKTYLQPLTERAADWLGTNFIGIEVKPNEALHLLANIAKKGMVVV